MQDCLRNLEWSVLAVEEGFPNFPLINFRDTIIFSLQSCAWNTPFGI